MHLQRLELIAKPDHEHRERYCRVMAYNDTHGMLAVTQPSFTALAPGYGVRRVNMLDLRVGKLSMYDYERRKTVRPCFSVI